MPQTLLPKNQQNQCVLMPKITLPRNKVSFLADVVDLQWIAMKYLMELKWQATLNFFWSGRIIGKNVGWMVGWMVL